MWGIENEYIHAALVILLTIGLAKLFQGILVHYLRKLTKRTETDLDDLIVDISSRPLFYLIVLAGMYFTIASFTVLIPYQATIGKVFFVIFATIFALLIAKVTGLLIARWFMAHRGVKGSPKLINIIVSFVVYIIALIIVLSHFDVEISPLVATLGVGGLAVGLALQDTLSNVFAGIHIISDQPVRVKDFVELPEKNLRGTVTDIGWRSTRIKTFSNNIVIVPNSLLAGSIITNFHMPNDPTKTVVLCGVDYGSDLQHVENVALDVATKIQKKTEGAVRDHEPAFRYHNFGDSNIDFKVILAAETRGDTFFVVHEFVKQLHARFEKEGIEISWPVRKTYPMQPTEPKVKKRVKKATTKRSTDEDLDL